MTSAAAQALKLSREMQMTVADSLALEKSEVEDYLLEGNQEPEPDREHKITTMEDFRKSDLNSKSQSKCKQILKANILTILNVGGIIVGLALGFGLRETRPSKDALMWIGFAGELFLRIIRMLILPLIICSVISGSARMDPKCNGKLSIVSLIFMLTTHIIACCIGVSLAIAVKPGVGNQGTDNFKKREHLIETQDIFADLFRNLVPNNIIEVGFRQAQTKYEKVTNEVLRNGTNGSFIEQVESISKSNGYAGGLNVLGLIAISTIFGAAIGKARKKNSVFLQFFVDASDIILIILRGVFWFGPIGIASLIAKSIAQVSNIEDVFSRLGLFVLVVVVGLILYEFIVLPLIFFVFTRRNPYKYILLCTRALLLAFASTSTAVAIPEMLVACDEHKIDKRVSRFIIPFSLTLSASGSLVYITSATVFIIQLSFGYVTSTQAIIIIILSTVCGTAIPPVPSASIVTLIIILTSLNVPITQVALMFAVEWFLDRIRTQANIIGHTVNCAVTYKLCKKNLQDDQNVLVYKAEMSSEDINTRL